MRFIKFPVVLKYATLILKNIANLDALRRESDQLRQELCTACIENNYAQVLDVLAKSSTTSRDRRDVLGPGKQVRLKTTLIYNF